MYTYRITCSQCIWCFVQVLEEESYAEARARPLALTKPTAAVVSTAAANSSAVAVSFDRSTSDTTTSASARPHPATLLKQLSI